MGVGAWSYPSKSPVLKSYEPSVSDSAIGCHGEIGKDGFKNDLTLLKLGEANDKPPGMSSVGLTRY